MSTYNTPSSSRHASYARQQQQQPQSYTSSTRQVPSSQSGFLSYSANHRNVVPPRPLSLRPISQATSIAVDSDYESYSDSVSKRERGRSMAGSKGWRQGDIKEECEDGTSAEDVSDAESMESLSSRARNMAGILSDSDSMHSRTRTSISSFSEAATPEGSPVHHYGEPAIYDPDQKNPMMFRHSISYAEDLPRYTPKDSMSMATTIGPRGPHLFRSLSVQSNSITRLASTADFIPPTPITPLDVTEFVLPPSFPAPPPLPQFKAQQQQQPPTPSQPSPAQSTFRGPPSAVPSLPQFRSAPPSAVPSLPEERLFNPERDIRPISMHSAAVINDYANVDISEWTPQQVCDHFSAIGFDRAIVGKFASNDISGQILVDLKWEDLKELDIQSFGRRVELWSEIHHLRTKASNAPVEQFAQRPESKVSRAASYRSGKPSPATSRPPMTPRTPFEPLKPIAFTPGLPEEDEEAAPNSSGDDEETTIAVRVIRNPTRRRRVNSRRGTHARISRRHFANDSATDANETEEEQTIVHRSDNNLPTLHESRAPNRRNRNTDSIHPGDSISVVGASRQQAKTCKAHKKCKKGDKCGAHGKGLKQIQLRGLERAASTSETIFIAATPSIADSPRFELNLPDTRPGSVVAPSFVASSDVLGHVHSKEVKLQENALRDVIRMDPTENVKKFLIHQHLQHLEERRNSPPPVPQKSNDEMMRSHSYDQYHHEENMASNQNSPIADQEENYEDYEDVEEDNLSNNGSVHLPIAPPADSIPPPSPITRGKTPALGIRTTNLTPAPANTHFSPVTFKGGRSGSLMRTTTPFSEMDVPVSTGTPMMPEFRNQSASVPPDMTYGLKNNTTRGFSRSSFNGGSTGGRLMAPAPPPPGAAGISRRGAQSTTGIRPTPARNMTSLDESAEWEDDQPMRPKMTGNGAQVTSGSANTSSSIRVHSGWMRKRKTNWFKHEWPQHHFVLRGTRLGIHKDQHSAEDGFIEMDEYSVACSNSNSTKLSAAFKSWKIKNDQGNTADGAFFFQLVPCSEKEKRSKGIATNGEKKIHHFAVKSRDERIDWMRELMLAKAIKQKGQGYTVEVNGEKI
ncbi:hypothetical protein DFH27DRAFT_324667 [Peziza echinospora]|nr:hypothetical protein DFH27DRAFT_324667 [Peziza echinospora]